MAMGPVPLQGLARLVIAALFGWLVSWLGVAILITLSVARPHDPIPRVLLVVWAVLVAVSFAIPSWEIRGQSWLVLVLAVPLVPLVRAAVAVWPHLPEAVQDLLEGNFRRHRWARLQRKQAR